ncbi:response regulator [Prauserella cavernicola]|uniref:Response regulator n=1 Tax=Prauserella cavernicola TaxID=2800127 RepID=A0A934QQ79_9PSEU|nr:response regulator [Prauserella cavernicola]MBK1784610.1 response regulator [Prauserella cavernicola]
MTRRLLVVDDDPDLRELLGLCLLDTGWLIDTAADGEEGLHRCRDEHYDGVLLDLDMPRLDGRQTLAALRADAGTASVPVVFLTAAADPALTATLTELGAADVLGKPFDPTGLGARLAAAFGWLTTTDDRLGGPQPAA